MFPKFLSKSSQHVVFFKIAALEVRLKSLKNISQRVYVLLKLNFFKIFSNILATAVSRLGQKQRPTKIFLEEAAPQLLFLSFKSTFERVLSPKKILFNSSCTAVLYKIFFVTRQPSY